MQDKIIDIVAEISEADENKITMDSVLEEIGISGMEEITLMMSLEDVYGVEILDDEVSWLTVGDVYKHMEQLVNK